MLESVYSILPSLLKTILTRVSLEIQNVMEEIRIRENRPLEIIYLGKSAFVNEHGLLSDQPVGAYLPTKELCNKLLDLITNHSVYSYEEELKRGYITIIGGHRVGLAGRTVLEQGRVKLIRDISSFNIRVAREIINCSKPTLAHLIDPTAQSIHHTLVISPPQQGKTTFIRDLARLISSGDWPYGYSTRLGQGLKVGIVDERSELAACVKGVPIFNVGPRTDVLDGCPKAEGMMMMIRSLSPEVLVVDEIGKPEDAAAIHEALHAGVRVIASAHGKDILDIRGRPVLRQLYEEALFTRYVILNKSNAGRVAQVTVTDGEGNPLR